MNWETLTSPEFEAAVESCGRVCLLPLGVVEKHGDHLPLGTDYLYIHKACSLAAEQEEVMVFPPFYLGQIIEARHVPGTIALNRKLLLPVLENICDEIYRNGFTKILLVNGHGGNNAMLSFFSMTMLEGDKDYITLISHPWMHGSEEIDAVKEARDDGHAGEQETCCMLHLFPELVKADRFRDYGEAQGRFREYAEAGLSSGISWYAEQPGHLKGREVPFTSEKGEVFVKTCVDTLIRQIRLLKRDDAALELVRAFNGEISDPANRFGN